MQLSIDYQEPTVKRQDNSPESTTEDFQKIWNTEVTSDYGI